MKMRGAAATEEPHASGTSVNIRQRRSSIVIMSSMRMLAVMLPMRGMFLGMDSLRVRVSKGNYRRR